jgi:hypothetical protein
LGNFNQKRNLGLPWEMFKKKILRSSVIAQGGATNWYVGIAWAFRTRWRHHSAAERQFQSFGQIVDLLRLWALLKSRGKKRSLVFAEGKTEK